MKKNAFTLVELLAVITILSILAIVTFPNIIGVFGKSKAKIYEEQERIIIKAAQAYYTDHPDKLPPLENGKETNIPISTLISEGYIENENLTTINDGTKVIKNPKTNTIMNGQVTITYKNDKYEYKYNP